MKERRGLNSGSDVTDYPSQAEDLSLVLSSLYSSPRVHARRVCLAGAVSVGGTLCSSFLVCLKKKKILYIM